MPRTCTICAHPERAKIDSALASGTSYRNIAERFHMPLAVISRHKAHVGQSIVRAAELREVNLGGSLIDQMRALVGEAQATLGQMKQEKDWRGCVVAIRTMAEILDRLSAMMDKAGGNGDKQRLIDWIKEAEADWEKKHGTPAEAEGNEQQRPN